MLIAPGKNLVCTRDIVCPCGTSKATKDAIYLCEEVGFGGVVHRLFCDTEGCDSCEVAVKGQPCGLCACCFKPLDDGDTSLVEEETAIPYEKMVELEKLKRKHDFELPPIKKPERVLV